MRLALQEAKAAFLMDEVPVGAVITDAAGGILGKGRNQTQRLNDPTAHAEMIALTAACNALGAKYLRGCALFVTLEPCPMCAAALRWAQIAEIYYGADDPKNGFRRWSEALPHARTKIASGLLRDDCAKLMRTFFQGKRP